MGAGGMINVKVLRKVLVEGVECSGSWQASTRSVELASKDPPSYQWRTLFHELTHAAMDDSGVSNFLNKEGEEALCDAMATAWIQAMRHHLKLAP
jgi:Zn-dependent peptidase ImmA (M78 family)